MRFAGDSSERGRFSVRGVYGGDRRSACSANSVIPLRNLHDALPPAAAHDRIVLGKTGQGSDGADARLEDAMYPGLSEADCRVAEFRLRHLVSEGQHRQFVASVCPVSADTSSVSARFRQHLRTFLGRAGKRFQCLQTVMKSSRHAVAIGERDAIA